MESRARASYEQYYALLEYMERHGDLSRPQAAAQGRAKSSELWYNLSGLLNSIGGGVFKPVIKWKKMWADWKTKTKAKALLIQKHARGTGGGPHSQRHLTALEERVLAIMGREAVSGQDDIEERGLTQTRSIQAQNQPVENLELDHASSSRDWAPHGRGSTPAQESQTRESYTPVIPIARDPHPNRSSTPMRTPEPESQPDPSTAAWWGPEPEPQSRPSTARRLAPEPEARAGPPTARCWAPEPEARAGPPTARRLAPEPGYQASSTTTLAVLELEPQPGPSTARVRALEAQNRPTPVRPSEQTRPAASTPQINSQRPLVATPSSTRSSPRRVPRARRRLRQTPFDRATSEFVAIEKQRLHIEEVRETKRLHLQEIQERNLHERENQRLHLEQEMIGVLRRVAEVGEALLAHFANKDDTVRLTPSS